MKNIKTGLKMLVFMTLITGIVYPLMVTGFARVFFPSKADGSMIIRGNKTIGSELIGQQFASEKYFWGRPSAIGYNPVPSGGSNLSPVGKKFKAQFDARVDTIRKYHGNIAPSGMPRDLLFASGSGADPHISPEAAYFQAGRVAKARGFDEAQKRKLMEMIKKSVESPDLFILGEKRVNVLLLNLKLDEQESEKSR